MHLKITKVICVLSFDVIQATPRDLLDVLVDPAIIRLRVKRLSMDF
jgi:hypothetical protein